MSNNEILYQYIASKLNINIDDAKSKYANLCYYTTQSAKLLKYQELQNQTQQSIQKIDITKVQTQYMDFDRKIQMTTFIYQQQKKDIETEITSLNDDDSNDYNDKLLQLKEQLFIIEQKYTNDNATLIQQKETCKSIIDDYNAQLNIINSMTAEYTPDDWAGILVWNTTDIDKPTEKQLAEAELVYNTVQLQNLKNQKVIEFDTYYNQNKYILHINGVSTSYTLDKIYTILSSFLEQKAPYKLFIPTLNSFFNIKTNVELNKFIDEVKYLTSSPVAQKYWEDNYNAKINGINSLTDCNSVLNYKFEITKINKIIDLI